MAARATRVKRAHINHVKKRQTAAFEHGALTGAIGTSATVAAVGTALHKHLQHYSVHAKVGTHDRDGGGYEAHLYSTKNLTHIAHSPVMNNLVKGSSKVVRGAGGRFVSAAVKKI